MSNVMTIFMFFEMQTNYKITPKSTQVHVRVLKCTIRTGPLSQKNSLSNETHRARGWWDVQPIAVDWQSQWDKRDLMTLTVGTANYTLTASWDVTVTTKHSTRCHTFILFCITYVII